MSTSPQFLGSSLCRSVTHCMSLRSPMSENEGTGFMQRENQRGHGFESHPPHSSINFPASARQRSSLWSSLSLDRSCDFRDGYVCYILPFRRKPAGSCSYPWCIRRHRVPRCGNVISDRHRSEGSDDVDRHSRSPQPLHQQNTQDKKRSTLSTSCCRPRNVQVMEIAHQVNLSRSNLRTCSDRVSVDLENARQNAIEECSESHSNTMHSRQDTASRYRLLHGRLSPTVSRSNSIQFTPGAAIQKHL